MKDEVAADMRTKLERRIHGLFDDRRRDRHIRDVLGLRGVFGGKSSMPLRI
jgi:hypothetical protein